jgi:hypothetical protein
MQLDNARNHRHLHGAGLWHFSMAVRAAYTIDYTAMEIKKNQKAES